MKEYPKSDDEIVGLKKETAWSPTRDIKHTSCTGGILRRIEIPGVLMTGISPDAAAADGDTNRDVGADGNIT